MSPKKDNFITITNQAIWEMLEKLIDSVGKLSSTVEGIGHTIGSMEKKITEYEGNFKKYEKLENKVIGGWVVLTILGISILFMGKVYLKSVITGIVKEVVSDYNIEVIN